MFDALQENLSGAFRSLRGRGKLTEANMRDGLAEVREALLEADVSFSAVRDFMAKVTEQAVGERVLKSLDPSQQVIGIVHQELIELMGPVDAVRFTGIGENHFLCKNRAADPGAQKKADALRGRFAATRSD